MQEHRVRTRCKIITYLKHGNYISQQVAYLLFWPGWMRYPQRLRLPLMARLSVLSVDDFLAGGLGSLLLCLCRVLGTAPPSVDGVTFARGCAAGHVPPMSLPTVAHNGKREWRRVPSKRRLPTKMCVADSVLPR
jgi:hypothetical protein